MVKEFNKNFRIGQGGLVETAANLTILSTNKPRVVLVDATAGPVTVTLPLAAGVGGKKTCVIKIDASANAVIIAANAADTVNGAATDSISNQFENVDYLSDNENAWFKVAVGTGGGGGGAGALEKIGEFVVTAPQLTMPVVFGSPEARNTYAELLVIADFDLAIAGTVQLSFDGFGLVGTFTAHVAMVAGAVVAGKSSGLVDAVGTAEAFGTSLSSMRISIQSDASGTYNGYIDEISIFAANPSRRGGWDIDTSTPNDMTGITLTATQNFNIGSKVRVYKLPL